MSEMRPELLELRMVTNTMAEELVDSAMKAVKASFDAGLISGIALAVNLLRASNLPQNTMAAIWLEQASQPATQEDA